MTANNAWIEVCEQLKCHNQGADRCIDTLNRLWRKNPLVKSATGVALLDVPHLSETMLSVSLEHWPFDRLVALKTAHDDDTLRSLQPIVVLLWFDQDFLIDGHHRVNYWKKKQNQGPHAVLKIAEAKGDI